MLAQERGNDGREAEVPYGGVQGADALAALKADRTVNELASQFGVHPTQIHDWKRQLLASADSVFTNGSKPDHGDAEAQKAELFEHIGRLKMELEWLKKSRPFRLSSYGR